MNRTIQIALIICLFATIANAQNAKEKIEFKLHLRDGSIVSGTSESIREINLDTEYGELTVPIKNVSSIDFGLASNAETTKKVKLLIAQMYSGDAKMQQGAYEELTSMDISAIPAIENYLYSEEYKYNDSSEVLFSTSSVLNFLKAQHGISETYKEIDEVTIDMVYKMGGSYNIKEISVKTEYGTLTIPKMKIDRVNVIYHDLSGSGKSFQLFASINIHSNENGGWLNTGIHLNKGQKFSIISSGEVSLASLSSNIYTPDGKKGSTYTSTSKYPQYGNVVYKIGELGQAKKAGSKISGIASTSGTLYLSIYETMYNKSNTGAYMVRVNTK